MFFLLVLQFLVGMTANLFIVIPHVHPGSTGGNWFAEVAQGVPWALVHGPALLQLHVSLGIAIGVFATWLLLQVRAAGRGGYWLVVGWFGVLSAAGNGASFLDLGHDFSSALMSLGFAIAIVSYVMLLARPAGGR